MSRKLKAGIAALLGVGLLALTGWAATRPRTPQPFPAPGKYQIISQKKVWGDAEITRDRMTLTNSMLKVKTVYALETRGDTIHLSILSGGVAPGGSEFLGLIQGMAVKDKETLVGLPVGTYEYGISLNKTLTLRPQRYPAERIILEPVNTADNH